MKKVKKNKFYDEEKLEEIKDKKINIIKTKKENEEKQEEVKILENSEEIYGIVEG